MATIDDLKAKAAAAKARRAAALLTPEQVETARLLQELEEDTAAARADERAARAIRGAQVETEARTAAKGRYLVRYLDLGTMLPDADPEQLPGAGVLVMRSPPAAALTDFQRELEAEQRDLQAVYGSLVCESVVYPDLSGEAAGAKFRAFLESDLGCGTVITIGDAAAKLGGAVAARTKRGRG